MSAALKTAVRDTHPAVRLQSVVALAPLRGFEKFDTGWYVGPGHTLLGNDPRLRHGGKWFVDAFGDRFDLDKPLIAAVNGPAAGAGLIDTRRGGGGGDAAKRCAHGKPL